MIKTSNIKYQISSINRGFTLIELLVVMTLIGLLVGISLFAMGGARESARDGSRKADLEAVRSALELYKADCDEYPMDEVPQDPLIGSRDYYYSSTGTTYELCAALEDPPSSPDSCGGSCTVACNYKVANP
jgi:general secretion pathway protein G